MENQSCKTKGKTNIILIPFLWEFGITWEIKNENAIITLINSHFS